MQRGREVQKFFEDEFLKPSLKFGALGGVFGLLLGTASGTLRTKTPVLFAAASGIQCFVLGTTYWASRTGFLYAKTFHPPASSEPNSSTYLKASSAAGCLTGSSMGFLFRGPRNIIPGAIMFTIFGFGGQGIYNFLDQRHTQQIVYEQKKVALGSKYEDLTLWRRFVDWFAAPENKWSPVSKLSDQEYEARLQEKLIGIEADLALIDEEIAKLRREESKKGGQ